MIDLKNAHCTFKMVGRGQGVKKTAEKDPSQQHQIKKEN